MKPLLCLLFFAAQGLHFDVTDARGKETSAVTLEAGAPETGGWQTVKIAKAKGDPVLIWPFDGLAATPDGPEPIPAIVIQRGDRRALANKPALAAMLTPILVNAASLNEISNRTGFTTDALTKAFNTLASSADPFEKGAGLLYAAKAADAAEQLATALKQRQRQLTRVPSEIYPLALIYGHALYRANKFDDAAVAFLTALKLRPADAAAAQMRADALVKAGKAEATGR